MVIKVGSGDISVIKYGAIDVQKAYYGAIQVFPPESNPIADLNNIKFYWSGLNDTSQTEGGNVTQIVSQAPGPVASPVANSVSTGILTYSAANGLFYNGESRSLLFDPSPLVPGNTDLTIVMYTRCFTSGRIPIIAIDGTLRKNPHIVILSGGVTFGTWSNDLFVATPANPINQWIIVTYRYNLLTRQLRGRIRGFTSADGSLTLGGNANWTNLGYYMGATPQGYDGNIREVVIANDNASDDVIAAIESDMLARWA